MSDPAAQLFNDDEDIFGSGEPKAPPPPQTEEKKDDVKQTNGASAPSVDDLFDVTDEIDLDGEKDIKDPLKPAQLLLDDSDFEPEQSMEVPKTPPLLPSRERSPSPPPHSFPTPPASVTASEKEQPAQLLPSISPFSEVHSASAPTHPPTQQLSKKPPKSFERDNVLDTIVSPPECPVEISVVEYEKRGEGMSGYVVFKVHTKAGNAPGFHKKEYVVYRRFSDFLGLHDKLSHKHLINGRIVPPPPEKSVVGMTKTKMSKGNVADEEATSEFLERRRASLERFLVRVGQHPTLLQDPDFRDFVTMESDLPKATSTSALSGAGVKRIFNRVGDALSKMAYRMDESDRWFEEKQTEIEELDESLKKLHSSVEYLVHYRRELASSTDLFCKSMSMLAACEENTALSRAFSQLAETQEKVGLIQADQAEKDFFIFSEVLKDYIALIGTVKEVFYERVKVWNNWQSAQQNLVKKRELKTRMELSGKTDKLPGAKREVQDAEERVKEMEEEFERISKMIRTEMKRFDTQRVYDFKQTLLQYLESLSLTQQQLVKYWEAFVPEAKAIIS